MDAEDLDNRFDYHQPPTVERSQHHARVRTECRYLATVLDWVVPDGREKSLAITKLEEVMMWANAGIARQ